MSMYDQMPYYDIYPRRKDEEDLDWYSRVIKSLSDSGHITESRIKKVLLDLAADAHCLGIATGKAEQKDQDAAASRDLAKVTKELEQLRLFMTVSVSKSDAEEGRLGAARAMRKRAAMLAEGNDGIPTMLSVAIDSLPDPKPKWKAA